jgi:rhodanese-related sulfurtransferase
MMITDNPVLRVPPGPPEQAVAFFAAKLRHETDVSDVYAALERGRPGFVLVDSRGGAARAQAHIPGSVHLPTDEIEDRALRELDPTVPVVTYCWGPACNGATRAALALARLGFSVKEMIGGIEYWIREGLPVRTPAGVTSGPVDPQTAAVATIACAC